MKLQQFQVQKFRNIVDSGPINVQHDVTCLVGMNEAGKSAILTALARLNPARPDAFRLQEDYPRWLKAADTRAGLIDDVEPIRATFRVEPQEKSAVEAAFGEGVLAADEVTLSRGYNDTEISWDVAVDENRAATYLVEKHGIPASFAATFSGLRTLADLKARATEARDALNDEPEAGPGLEELNALIADLGSATYTQGLFTGVVRLLRVPTFFYFSDYSTLDGRIDLDRLAGTENEQAGYTSDQTARSLLALAHTTPAMLSGEDYEDRKAELDVVTTDVVDSRRGGLITKETSGRSGGA